MSTADVIQSVLRVGFCGFFSVFFRLFHRRFLGASVLRGVDGRTASIIPETAADYVALAVHC